MSKTVPNLDEECDRVHFDAVKLQLGGGEKIKDAFKIIQEDDTKAVEVVYENEDRIYLRGEKPYRMLNTNGAITETEAHYVSDIINKNVRDINVVPVKRCPRWGDGSIYHSCYECSQPIIESERVSEFEEGARYYHEDCHN